MGRHRYDRIFAKIPSFSFVIVLSSQFADRLSRKVYFLGEHEHPVAMEGAKETLGDKDVLGISLGAWEMEGTKEILGLPLGD